MEDKIFSLKDADFEALALEIFHFQYHSNSIYQSWVQHLGVSPTSITSLKQIPFLPIDFFKTHAVKTTDFEPAAVFESSGTTGTMNSRHYVKSLDLYRKSFLSGFEYFYGSPDQYVILGLLPSYLERKNSSLIVMVNELIRKSGHPSSGFYLHDHDRLENTLLSASGNNQKIFLIGVTFALLDFVESRQLQLTNAIVMETGGMKGRRKELTRSEVHDTLKIQLGVSSVHSEYGMTELLSQAYSKNNGIFQSPPWMKILLREEEDPLTIKQHSLTVPVKGVMNIIDLANIYSCSFIATDDIGSLLPEGFTVEGRLDKSEVRGCSLLSV
jgi:hypothetical protein